MLFGIAILSISQLQAYNAPVAQIADVYTPAQGYLLNADRDSQQALVAERSLVLLSPTSEEFEAQRQEHADNITQITERMESYAKLIDADWSNALMEQFWPQFDAWKEASLGLIKETGQNRTGNRPVINRSLTEVDAQFNAMRDIIDAADEELSGVIDQQALRAAKSYQRSRMLVIVAAIGAIAAGLVSAIWTLLSLSRSLGRAQDALQRVMSGDLTAPRAERGHDEIAVLLSGVGTMVGRLRDVVTKPTSNARRVAAASSEMAATAAQLIQGASEQASATEQASASVEQMAANIEQTAHSAGEMERDARQSLDSAREVGVMAGASVSSMQAIAEKILVMQEIACQVDLLALNAAVETARAGEHGRGFAVVASEVRKLAERSQNAAVEVAQLSGQTLKGTEQARPKLEQLVADIARTAELMSQIARANEELSTGATQVALAIEQLNDVTQQNTAASEQVSTTAGELAGRAEALQTGMAFFRLDASQAQPAPGAPIAEVQPLVAAVPERRKPKPAAASSGFAFDLDDAGEDELDAQFTRATRSR